MTIESRVPYGDYAAVNAISISRLKEIGRSPQHYQYRLAHPKETPALSLGVAAHVATLEPERFERQFAVWDRRSESGRMAPRNGKWWDAFQLENRSKTIITEDEAELARNIAAAVRNDPIAGPYLESGEPEVSMSWELSEDFGRRPCKGRLDWLTRPGANLPTTLVGLKSARDCRPFHFGRQAAQLGYHLQHAWYHDGFAANKGGESPRMVEIVVESEPPHAVVVYSIPQEVIDLGRDEYMELVKILLECEATGVWPGPVQAEEPLVLPAWAFPSVGDDISDLGLEVA